MDWYRVSIDTPLEEASTARVDFFRTVNAVRSALAGSRLLKSTSAELTHGTQLDRQIEARFSLVAPCGVIYRCFCAELVPTEVPILYSPQFEPVLFSEAAPLKVATVEAYFVGHGDVKLALGAVATEGSEAKYTTDNFEGFLKHFSLIPATI